MACSHTYNKHTILMKQLNFQIYTLLHDKKIDKIRSLKQHFSLEFNQQGSGWLPAAVRAAVKQNKSFLPHIHIYQRVSQ